MIGFLFVLLFEVGFCSVVQAVLKLTVFLPRLPRCWNFLTLQILRTNLKPYLLNLLTYVRACVCVSACVCLCACVHVLACVHITLIDHVDLWLHLGDISTLIMVGDLFDVILIGLCHSVHNSFLRESVFSRHCVGSGYWAQVIKPWL